MQFPKKGENNSLEDLVQDEGWDCTDLGQESQLGHEGFRLGTMYTSWG